METYVNNRLARQIHDGCDFGILSDHDDLTIETIEKFQDKDWDWTSIMHHPNFSIKWLKRLPNAPWEWNHMHASDKFRMYWIQVFVDKPWNQRAISCRATIEDLRNFPTFPWVWSDVTCYSNISCVEMIANNDLPWDFFNLGFTDILDDEIRFLRFFQPKFGFLNWADFSNTVKWEVFRKNLDLPWVYYRIQWDHTFVESDLNIIRTIGVDKWNWESLSRNVPLRFIKRNIDLPWIGSFVSQNPTLAYHHLSKLNLEWDYSHAPTEHFTFLILDWHSANVIKWAWKKAISNPEYKMCRDRLLKESKELESMYING